MWPTRTHYETFIILIIAVVLASMTTYCLENPIRYKKILTSSKSLLTTNALFGVILLLLTLSTIVSKGFSGRWKYDNIDLHSIQYNFDQAFNVGSCFIDDRHTLPTLLNAGCLTPQKKKTNILIIGDSFAAHLMPGLEHHFPDIHFNQATASACRALHGFAESNSQRQWPCPALNQLVFSQSFLAANQYSAIILMSDWQYGYDGALDPPALLKTIMYLNSVTNTPIIVFGNTPVYKNDTRISLRSHTLTGYMATNKLTFRDGLLEMEYFNNSNSDHYIFISMLENYCNNEQCPLLTSDNKMVHFGIHLTEWGAIDIIGATKNKLGKLFNRLDQHP
jgi:hypothetical protein